MRASGLPSELDAALTEYVRAAADCLRAEIDAGAEVELELGSQRGRGGAQTPFYSCRPLTGRFIAQRESALERLPEHGAAVAALEGFGGLDRYLAGWGGQTRGAVRADVLRSRAGAGVRGATHTRARTAAGKLIEDVFAEQTEFELRPERLAAALARVERAELTSTPDTVTLVATLHGLTIASAEVKLTKGLTIATPEALRWAPRQALMGIDGGDLGGEDREAPGHLLVALTCEEELDHERPEGDAAALAVAPEASREELAIAHGREVLRDLLRALRLFGGGRGVMLGPLAWARRGGEDTWDAVALGTGGRRPQGMLVVSPEQEDELRAFCNLVSRRAPAGNELAWALRRFELGCEREGAYEALSDHLLALRALLEPEGASSGLLAGRIAALCATPENRVKLTERMTRAQKLERAVIAGAAAERAAGLAIARDLADHLRALLRDVICGHLTPDLVRLADELLAPPPLDSRVRQASDAAHGAQPVRAEQQQQQILVEA
jgi:hypothetical protein